MKKTMFCMVTVLWSTALATGAIRAEDGTVADDIAAFQGYFLQKFPEVALEEYHDGVNALPQYAHRRANWELIMEFPPFESDMDKAREEWSKPFANGRTFNDCFSGKPPANKYPYYDTASDEIRTVVGDINACLKANGEKPIKNLWGGKIARLAAAFVGG